jgi:hypothetical protein
MGVGSAGVLLASRMGVAILIVVAIYLFALPLLLSRVRRSRRLLRRFAKALTRIADIEPSGEVHFCGQVVPSAQGVLSSPNGEQAVCWSAKVYDLSHDSGQSRHEANERRQFWVDDGSGRRALVLPTGCSIVTRTTQHGDNEGGQTGHDAGDAPRDHVDMTQTMLAWAQATSAFITGDRIVVLEEVIAPGQQVHVLAATTLQPDGTLCARGDGDDSLVVSNYSDSDIGAVLGGASRRYAALTIFLTIACGALVAGLWWFGSR